MTAWGVVAVCAAGGVVIGPALEAAARRVRPSPSPSHTPEAGSSAALEVALPGVTPAVAGVGEVLPAGPSPADPVPATPAVPAAKGVGLPISPVVTVGVSLVTAALFGLAAVRVGDVPELAGYCALFAGLVAVSVADLRTGLVPRRLLYPALALVAAALLAASGTDGRWHSMVGAVVGGACGFALFAAIWWVYPRGMGFGDVRLAGLCGAGLGWLGYRQLYLGFLASFVLGALMGGVLLAVRGTRRFPFAPAMAAGTAFGVLWGGWLGNLWLHPG